MATSTFERKIIISNPDALERLEMIMENHVPIDPISNHPFTYEDRKRGEMLLNRCQLHSPH